MTFMRHLSEYGMLFVLLLLCLFFSVVTYSEQYPSDSAAAHQLASEITKEWGEQARVLIVVRNQREEVAFAEALRRELEERGERIVGMVQGEPRDARQELGRLQSAGQSVDAIACNRVTSTWLVLQRLDKDFPALGNPRLVTPRSYGWPNFLKRDNLLNIANQIAVIAILAVGMTMVIISGGIDLSVGSLIALSAVVTGLAIRDWGGALQATVPSMVLASLLGMLTCALVGLVSGIMVTAFRVPPFIVTLAMMLVANGAAYLLAKGQSVYQIPESFTWLGRGADLGLPNAVVLMGLLYVAAHLLMSRTVVGRYVYAVGGNAEAARLSGVPVQTILLFAYVSSGILAGLGGVVMASQLKSGSPTYGQMYELYVIAAVVVGGTSLSGGEGKILGTLVGAFIIAVIQNGMNLTNVESYTQRVVLGLVILGAVLLDKARHRRLGTGGV